MISSRELLAKALDYKRAGLDVIPDHPQLKYPADIKGWQKKEFTDDELKYWIVRRGYSIGIRHQEGLDFDNKGDPSADEMFYEWAGLVNQLCPGLVDRLTIEKTQGKGYHVVYKCSVIEGNQDLAQRPATLGELTRKPEEEVITLIETRGLGGQFMVAPSPGYELVQGDWLALPEITPEERDFLFSCARTFHRIPNNRPDLRNGDDKRPGDYFNEHHADEVLSLLEQAGWQSVHCRGDGSLYLRRPGKDRGVSATFGYVAPNCLYVFSSNASPFEPGNTYSPFAIYATLQHGGDFKQAAKSLAHRFGLNGNGASAHLNGSHSEEQGANQQAEEPKPSHKTQWSADELLEAEFSEPKWTIKGTLPEGFCLLAARPKFGKSWLALQMSAAVGSGGRFFGEQVERGKVLYLALEDSPRRLKKRINAQKWTKGTPVTFKTEWPDLVAKGGLQALQDRIERDGYTFVIIDTLSRAIKFKQQEVEESTEVFSLLQRLAIHYGITILGIDHNRKPGLNGVDDVIDSVLGSTGKTAVADCIIGLFRARGETVATLKATGRDFEDKELSLKFDGLTCSWQLLGNAREVVTNKTILDILRKIEELGEEATQANLAEHTGLTKGFISTTVNKLRDDNIIIWEGKGRPYVLTPLGKENLKRTY